MGKRKLRLATIEDLAQLDQLIKTSATDLCYGFYSEEEVSALNQYLFGVNRFLLDDKTYFVIEDQETIVACGGWSKRSTVFGGDQFSINKNQWLDPQHDPAKIRAFFVHPDHVRRGLASILMIHCENEAIRHGFGRIELMATLSGVDLYLKHGFNEQGVKNVTLPNGLSVMFKPMLKSLLQHRELTAYQIDLVGHLKQQSPPRLFEIKPINARNREKKLDRDDFFVSIAALQNYLASLDFDVETLESDKIEQLTPLGLAIVADFYNNKVDQQCSILVACTAAELKNTIHEFHLASEAKAVVIFQPTEGTGERFFPSFHKTVIYLEKHRDQLHILHADCVHAIAIEGYVEKLTHEALPNGSFTFYKQQPMLHTDGSWLHLQAGYTQCGTHALRIARKLALRPKLLCELQIATQVSSTLGNSSILTYTLPIFLAVNADSSVTRAKLLTMYEQGKDRDNLANHFSKYSKYEYAGKFSNKYIEIVNGILAVCSDEELNERVDRVNDQKFQLKS